jgi:hypothetical protein
MAAAWVQNSEPAACALVSEALEPAFVEEEALFPLSDPPHAVSSTRAAATERPTRWTRPTLRMARG